MTHELNDARLARVVRRAAVPPSAIWSVLADGWLYASWVVGASRIRDVDPGWPAAGSRIHHSIGAWPALIDDETEVVRAVPDELLVLRAKGWPVGEAVVELRIEAAGDGACEVTMLEDATAGPGAVVPRAARQVPIAARNREALRRLVLLAEGRHGQGLG